MKKLIACMKFYVYLLIMLLGAAGITSCAKAETKDALTELFDTCWNGSEGEVFKYLETEKDAFVVTPMGSGERSAIHYESKEPMIKIGDYEAALILEFMDDALVLCGARLLFPIEEDAKVYELLYDYTAHYDQKYENDPEQIASSDRLFRGEKDYNSFLEESRAYSSIQDEWLCSNDARLYLTYGKLDSNISVLLFYMWDVPPELYGQDRAQ